MKTQDEGQLVAASRFYEEIIAKLNKTLATYRNLPDIGRCGENFEVLEQAAYSRDAQINHLLSITSCLLKYLPNSPGLEQIFTNFLKDYIHLVNPDMPPYSGELYLDASFFRGKERLDGADNRHPYYRQT